MKYFVSVLILICLSLYANPEYEITASGGGYSLAAKAHQATYVIYVGMGFVF